MSLKCIHVGYIGLETQVINKYNNYKVQNIFFTLNHIFVDGYANIPLDIFFVQVIIYIHHYAYGSLLWFIVNEWGTITHHLQIILLPSSACLHLVLIRSECRLYVNPQRSRILWICVLLLFNLASVHNVYLYLFPQWVTMGRLYSCKTLFKQLTIYIYLFVYLFCFF